MHNTEEKYLSNINSFDSVHIGDSKFTVIEDVNQNSHQKGSVIVLFGIPGVDWVVLPPTTVLKKQPFQSVDSNTNTSGTCNNCKTNTETTILTSRFDLNEPIGDSIPTTVDSEIEAINSTFGSGLTVRSRIELCSNCLNKIRTTVHKDEFHDTLKTRLVTDQI